MQFGIVHYVANPHDIVDLAVAADEAGWDGVFIADAVAVEMAKPAPWFDPWVVLGAMATHTRRIRLGTFITPVSRRRPWKLARETVTVDELSKGRLIIGVGLGAAEHDGGFYKVGERMELKVRAQLLDEGLEILAGLWTGKKFSFKGEHYTVDKLTLRPKPIQKPRIPVWVVGVWPKMKSMERAMRWDGIIPQKYQAKPSEMTLTPSETKTVRQFIDKKRRKGSPFDFIIGGTTSGTNRKRVETVRPYVEAGATWWLEHTWATDVKKLRQRIKEGPPRLS